MSYLPPKESNITKMIEADKPLIKRGSKVFVITGFNQYFGALIRRVNKNGTARVWCRYAKAGEQLSTVPLNAMFLQDIH